MNVTEFYEYLEVEIPAELSLDGDRDGLSVCPYPDAEVSRVLIALDVTADVIDEAIAEECQVILSHHPMIFGSIGSVCAGDRVGDKIIKLIRSGISVMSFHTRLDAAPGGVSDILAGLIGVKNTVPFAEKGICRIGELDYPVSAVRFADVIKEALGAPFVAFSDTGRPIRRVAVGGGSVKSFIGDALRAGADAMVGGEIGYHNLTDSQDDGICLFEAGHFFTENPVLSRLFELCVNAGVEPVMTFSDRIMVSK